MPSRLQKSMVAGISLFKASNQANNSVSDESVDKRFFMVNDEEELFASNPNGHKISESINIQNAGVKGKITLYKGEY